MAKWEYKDLNTIRAAEELNALSNEGWEVVTAQVIGEDEIPVTTDQGLTTLARHPRVYVLLRRQTRVPSAGPAVGGVGARPAPIRR